MWIKICGIRDAATAREVAKLKPQAIGLNFYARSPRAVAPETAAEIAQALPAEVAAVGVFVNHTLAEVEQLRRDCELDFVQLHGDEPPEFLAELDPRTVIRAFRVGAEGLTDVAAYLERCRALGALPAACLIDSRVEGTYGGSGRTVAWDLLEREYPQSGWPPLILAGGLHPGNIAAAIEAVRPWGVDVASGVESAPAQKDLRLVEEFIAHASR
jgi:phosphoribosylanthranilate isomerase